jgi:hypothetical protein
MGPEIHGGSAPAERKHLLWQKQCIMEKPPFR